MFKIGVEANVLSPPKEKTHLENSVRGQDFPFYTAGYTGREGKGKNRVGGCGGSAMRER